MRFILLAIAITLSSLATGCASFVVPSYSPDYAAIDSFKKLGATKVAIGKVYPTDEKAAVNLVTLRGARLMTTEGSFSAYLQEAIT